MAWEVVRHENGGWAALNGSDIVRCASQEMATRVVHGQRMLEYHERLHRRRRHTGALSKRPAPYLSPALQRIVDSWKRPTLGECCDG